MLDNVDTFDHLLHVLKGFFKNLTVMPDVRIPEWEERRLPRQCNSQKKGSLIADSNQGSRRASYAAYGVRER